MTPEEKRLEQAAIGHAKKHRCEIARHFTDPAIFVPETNPVSVFMGGSPGAGKTEASIALLNFKNSEGAKVMRIGPDELCENQFYRAGADQIDNHIPEKYSLADVRRTLGLT